MDNAAWLVLGVMVVDFVLMEEDAEDDGMLRNVCLRCCVLGANADEKGDEVARNTASPTNRVIFR